MTKSIRNSFILNHAFRKFFVASVFISVITQVNTLVSGIIVSQTVGEDAFSVINISMPILSLVMLMPSSIYIGVSLIMAGEIGNQNYKQVDRLFTMSLSSIFVLTLVLAIILYSCTNVISHLLTTEERLLSLLNSYLSIAFIGCIISAMQLSFAQFVKTSGQSGLVIKCMIVASLGNIVLALLFVDVFDMGIQGVAWASAMSSLFSILVFIPYFRSEHRPFKLVNLRGGWYGTLFRKCLAPGLLEAAGSVTVIVLVMGLNAIVLKNQGSDGLFILSVCLQMLMISMFIMGGTGNAIVDIGGVLLGEQDYEGAHLLVHNTFKKTCIGVIIASVVAIVFPSLLARLFGADGELLQTSIEPLRIFSFIFIPTALVILVANVFAVLNRFVICYMVNIGLVVCILPLVWLASYFAPEYLWHSIPAGMWLLLFLTAIATWCTSRRTKGLHWFYLTQMSANRSSMTYSVNYEMEDIERKLKELLGFVECYKLPRKLHLNIYHCLEEVMFNEVEMARYTKKEGTFDISVSDQEEKILVIVKDVGKPYNPIIKYIPNHIDDIDESQLSMLLVNGLCKNINYKYMNGVNCLYLNFNKTEV